MRILAVTNMYPSSGAPASGVFVEQQVQGLRAAGLPVEVVFIDRKQQGAMCYYRMTLLIRAAIESFAPDLVHVMYGGVMADQVIRLPNLPPAVVTFHGSDLLGENHSGLARRLISRYGVYCSRRAARRAAGVVVVARHLVNALPKNLDRHKLKVIPCGIDLDRFKPLNEEECRRQLGWRSDMFHVLFVSNNGDPVKRPELARAAVAELNSRGVKAELHELAGVPNLQVPAWFSASHALILTSVHEGSPMVIKEALASRLPIVSVDVGDVAERLEGVEGCYLAEPEPAGLALKLHRVWREKKRIEPGPRLRELSHLAIAAKLKEFYGTILQTAGRTTASTCTQLSRLLKNPRNAA
jgi:glycosyltransferase involved in cell wall biosynthesis